MNTPLADQHPEIYANVLEALSILSPLDVAGEPNTLVDLCRKAMSASRIVRIAVHSQVDRRNLISIIADAGIKVWVESDEIRDTLGIRHTETYVCFENRNTK